MNKIDRNQNRLFLRKSIENDETAASLGFNSKSIKIGLKVINIGKNDVSSESKTIRTCIVSVVN